ncbi:MAG: hypothetical protein H8E71_06820 [Candidatus Marinimicrobia bacterium]|nr:hypothetical protein [Candidatus Neomarinimicrobiota bacterium]MBL7109335.1 hypothetical protein [Candidatus Neomarinimicrobiota bacterium]
MKLSLKIHLFILTVLFVNGQSYTGSASFLKRGMSARAIGMGSAFTAVVDDASATFWNPAGLLNSGGFNFQLSDLQDKLMSFGDINSPQFAFSHSFRKPLLKRIYWAFGASANGYFVKNIDQYDSESNYEGSFNYGEYAIFLSTAFKIRFIKLGFTWKFIEQNFGLDDPFIQNNRKSLAQKPHDLGILFNPIDFLRVGMIVRDSVKLGLYDTYPQNRQLGLKWDWNKMKEWLPHILLAADIIVIPNSLNKVNLGFEYKTKNKGDVSFAIRGGLSNIIWGLENENINEIIQLNKKVSFGIGVRYKKALVDFSWVQQIEGNPYSSYGVVTLSIKN